MSHVFRVLPSGFRREENLEFFKVLKLMQSLNKTGKTPNFSKFRNLEKLEIFQSLNREGKLGIFSYRKTYYKEEGSKSFQLPGSI